MKKPLLALLATALLSAHCARKCPNDIELGTLQLSTATSSFVPAAQAKKTMTFKNATTGTFLTFSTLAGGVPEFTQMPVETLCERGDYLDKTSQIALLKYKNIRWEYASTDGNYTMLVIANMDNLGNYGSVKDTVLLETFAVAGQKLPAPIAVGRISIVTSERGNSAKINDQQRNSRTFFRTVADTTIAGRNIKNAYLPEDDGFQSMTIFYTKEKGVEAFVVGGEIWLRED